MQGGHELHGKHLAAEFERDDGAPLEVTLVQRDDGAHHPDARAEGRRGKRHGQAQRIGGAGLVLRRALREGEGAGDGTGRA